MRAIFFLLLVVLIFFIVRFSLNRIIEIRDKQRQAQQNENTQQQDSVNESNSENPQKMVRCAQCGVHLPQAEAYYDGRDTFCSEGHMQDFHAEQQVKK